MPTTSRSTNAAAGDVDPCELLPDAEAARLGLPTPGRSRKVAGNPACSWQASGQFSVIIGTDTKGLDGVTGQSVPLPKHKAIQSVDPGGFGGCGLFIETSAKSSVIVAVILSGGKPAEEACPRSTEVAKIVDSTLP